MNEPPLYYRGEDTVSQGSIESFMERSSGFAGVLTDFQKCPNNFRSFPYNPNDLPKLDDGSVFSVGTINPPALR